ncbi:MAG: hypothetical protein FWC15_05595 [Fibromonadales bacterium]|nr:hypothetical protein [Fibromonadales bacterium]
MKKIINIGLAAFMLLFSACGKESGEVKLLESITQGGETKKFEYDDKNRIVKMGATTIAYKSDDFVIIDGNEYKRKGNVITVSRDVDTYTLNKYASINSASIPYTVEYNYVGGNLTEIRNEGGSGHTEKYKYDDKNSPFNCNTPKWIIQIILEAIYASKNNVIEAGFSYDSDYDRKGEYSNQVFFKYEYDSDGFPTKRTSNGDIGNNNYTETITFTYRGKNFGKVESTSAETGSAQDNMAALAVSWPRMGVDEFGCMMEKTFGHRDERFNCSLIGYENKGTPCNNTDEYYEGLAFPELLVKKVHPQLSNINLSWEGGRLQNIYFSFDGAFTKEQVLKIFGLSQENTPDNIGYVDNAYDGSYLYLKKTPDNISYVRASDGSLDLTGFEHMGAGDVDCGDEAEEDETEEAKEHKSVKIGTQTWMAENLNDSSKGGKCYENKPENCEKYGRLYTWDEAMMACPSGWHLPSNEEWQTLVDFAGVEKVAGKKLKAKSGWNNNGNGTDDYGFSALPGGSTNEDGGFSDVGEFGNWWTSTEESGSGSAFVRALGENVSVGFQKWTIYLYSVRCVKD